MSEAPEFHVRLARSGQTLPVAREQSVLDVLEAAGIEIASSCQQGVCGTCVTRVLEGVPEHWDMYLTSQEQAANDRFCPCISRSATPLLVLDL
jgi:vanillate monooxygenase ferredoxin subunit